MGFPASQTKGPRYSFRPSNLRVVAARFVHMCQDYRQHFRVGNRDVSDEARAYLSGLVMKAPRKNIERMEEYVEGSDYQCTQHFVSESPWCHRGVLDHVARDVDAAIGGNESDLLIDESGFSKAVLVLIGSLTIGMCIAVGCSDDSSEPTNPNGGSGHGIVADTNPLVVLQQADTVFDYYESSSGTAHALDSLAAWFGSLGSVSSARICDDSISIAVRFSSGLHASYCSADPFSVGADTVAVQTSADNPADRLAKQARATVSIMEPGDATIALVYGGARATDRQQIDQAVEITRDSLEALDYTVTVHDTSNTTFDVAYFRDLFRNSPRVLTIFTHGVAYDSGYGLATHEEYTDYDPEADADTYIGAFRMRNGSTYKAVRADYIRTNFRAASPTFLTLHACHLGRDSILMHAFMDPSDSIVILAYTRTARMHHVRTITANLYQRLTDTCTIQQAYAALPNRYVSVLHSKPNADVLLCETFRCDVGPSVDHFMCRYSESVTHVDGADVDAYTISAQCCADDSGGTCDTSMNIVVPRTVGAHTAGDGAFILLSCGIGVNSFTAGPGLQGVSANVRINSIQDGFISGSYSGTVGIWAPGANSSETDPIETVSVNGRFKIN